MNKKQIIVIVITIGFVFLLFLSINLFMSSCTQKKQVNKFGSDVVVDEIEETNSQAILIGSTYSNLKEVPVYLLENRIIIYKDWESKEELASINLVGGVLSKESFLKDSMNHNPEYIFLICKFENIEKLLCYTLRPLATTKEEEEKIPLIKLMWEKDVDSESIISANFHMGQENGMDLVVCQSKDKKKLYYFDLDGNLIQRDDFIKTTVVGKINKNLVSFDGKYLRIWGWIDKKYDLGSIIPTDKIFFPGMGESGVWMGDGKTFRSININTGRPEWEFEAPGVKNADLGKYMYPYDKGTFGLVDHYNTKPRYSFVHLSNNKYEFLVTINDYHIASFQENDKSRLFLIKSLNKGTNNVKWNETELHSLEGKVLEMYPEASWRSDSIIIKTDKKTYKVKIIN